MTTPEDTALRAYLRHQRGLRMTDRDETTPVPPAWRTLGFLPAGAAFGGDTTLRQCWTDELLNGGQSRCAPTPDVIILVGASRRPLPGWCSETLDAWRHSHAGHYHGVVIDTRYDTRVLTMVTSNRNEGLRRARPLPTNGPLITLGYDAAARYVTSLGLTDSKGRPITMGASYLRRVWMTDLTRGYQAIAPIPDAIISRGFGATQLPGWTEQTLAEWPSTRQTPGNWTYGDQRARKPKKPATR